MTARSGHFDLQEIASGHGQLVSDYGGGALLAAGVFYNGSLLMFDQADSKIKPGITATTGICLGRCETPVSGTGTALGSVKVRSGIFGPFDNSSSADAIANDDAGKVCYIVDDATVALTSGSATRSIAGTIYKVDGNSKVWVSVDPLKVP
jgi:hypothetical protein